MKCIICFRPFENIKNKKRKIVYIKGCNHEFCKACIEKWFMHDYINYNNNSSARCPICRAWFVLDDITLKTYHKKNKIFMKRITRNDTKNKRSIKLIEDLRNYLNKIETSENEEICSDTCNKIFSLVYKNKWILYSGSSYNLKYLNELGIVFRRKLIELYDTVDRNIYSEIEVWRFKFHFLFN